MHQRRLSELDGLKPQPGPQTAFVESTADIVIYGGAAGGGKSYGMLLQPTRHIANSRFGGVIFRRTKVQVKNEGSLWDESQYIYPAFEGVPNSGDLLWTFPSGAAISFSQLEHNKSVLTYQGAQIPFIGFDELTHFSAYQFWYMLSRCRSMSGIPGYMRATCNPDPDSWVAEFIAWWINQDTGLAIPERSGVVRYVARVGDTIIWADSRAEMLRDHPEVPAIGIKSVTFIAATLYDNKKLMDKDPSYLGNLMLLPRVERERLLGGNWKIRPTGGIFQEDWFDIVDPIDPGGMAVRAWDLAATVAEPGTDPDWTVGLKVVKVGAIFYVTHMTRFRRGPADVDRSILGFAAADDEGGRMTTVRLTQDPGAAGKRDVATLVTKLAGRAVVVRLTGKDDKGTRARTAAAQAEFGNIKLVRGSWNRAFLDEVCAFGPGYTGHDDILDAFADAINELSIGYAYDLGNV